MEKTELKQIYVFAILSGVLYVLFSLLLNSVINLVQAGIMTSSLIIMIFILLSIQWMNSFFQVKQMRFVEKLQQKLFARYTLKFQEAILEKKSKENETINKASYFTEVLMLQKAAPKLLIDLTSSVFQIFLCLILLAFYHSLFLGGGIVIFVIGVISLYLTSNRVFQNTYLESKYKYQVFNILMKTALSTKTGDKDLIMNRLDKSGENYIGYRVKEFHAILISTYILFGFKWILTGLLLIGGAYLVINKQITIGQFVASEIIVILISSSVDKLVQLQEIYFSTLVSAEKIMDTCHLITEKVSITGQYIEQNQNEHFDLEIHKDNFTVPISIAIGQKKELTLPIHTKEIGTEIILGGINNISTEGNGDFSYLITKDSARRNQFINSEIFKSLITNEEYKDKLFKIADIIHSKNEYLEFIESHIENEEISNPFVMEIILSYISKYPVIVIENMPEQKMIVELIDIFEKSQIKKSLIILNYGK